MAPVLLKMKHINSLIDEGRLVVGKDVTIADDASLCVEGPEDEPLVLGDGCLLRPGCIVYSGCRFDSGVKIGNNSVIISKTVIGEGTYLGGLVYCEGHVKIGRHCGIGAGSYITKYVEIGDYVFFGPGVRTANDKSIKYLRPGHGEDLRGPRFGMGVRVGIGAIVLPGITVQSNALIGAGSIVTRDVEENAIVYGHPAKRRGTVSIGERIGIEKTG